MLPTALPVLIREKSLALTPETASSKVKVKCTEFAALGDASARTKLSAIGDVVSMITPLVAPVPPSV
ncbi:hypothetical protein D3C84_1074170 [compost metagenome]